MNPSVKVLHLIYRFDIGGLEKVLAECINHSPQNIDHIVISLTNITQYASENLNRSIEMIELNKKPGNDLSIYWKLYRLLKKINPNVLHTYNLPTLEYQYIGFLSGVKIRIHAEHGRDISDPHGLNKKYNLLRRLVNPVVQHWVVVSNDLENWLINTVRLPPTKIKRIYNGVDSNYFRPSKYEKQHKEKIVIGTIGRFDPIKNHKILIHAYQQIKNQQIKLANKLQFSIIGAGPEYENIKSMIINEQLEDVFYVPGVKYQIAKELSHFDIFVLPSIAEGVPMTLLEAMSMGLPSICTSVGGIPEVLNESTGILIEPQNIESLVGAIVKLLKQPKLIQELGEQARQEVIKKYSIQTMVKQYNKLYNPTNLNP